MRPKPFGGKRKRRVSLPWQTTARVGGLANLDYTIGGDAESKQGSAATACRPGFSVVSSSKFCFEVGRVAVKRRESARIPARIVASTNALLSRDRELSRAVPTQNGRFYTDSCHSREGNWPLLRLCLVLPLPLESHFSSHYPNATSTRGLRLSVFRVAHLFLMAPRGFEFSLLSAALISGCAQRGQLVRHNRDVFSHHEKICARCADSVMS